LPRRAVASIGRVETNSEKLSNQIARWQASEGEKTVGSIVDVFGEKGFAVLLVILMAVPALPAPTGGVTHVFEAIVMLLAVQLCAGRDQIWLPRRWRRVQIGGVRQQRFLARLTKLIRRLERFSRPRARFLFGRRVSNFVFGLLVIVGTVAAFVAPPFSGLDTLPALGVVVLSLGVLLEDILVVALGVIVGTGGIVLLVVLGRAAIEQIGDLAGFADGCAGAATALVVGRARLVSRCQPSPARRSSAFGSFPMTAARCRRRELGARCAGREPAAPRP
jgi:hypothetical protein